MNKYIIQTKYWFFIGILSMGMVLWFVSCNNPALFNDELAYDPLKNSEDFSEEVVFHNLLEHTACEDFSYHVWSYIYKIVSIEKGKPPPYYVVKEKIMQQVQAQIARPNISQDIIKQFAMRFVEIYAHITEFMQKKKKNTATEILVQLEHGVIHHEHKAFITKLQHTFTKLNHYAKKLNQNCLSPSEPKILSDRNTTQNMAKNAKKLTPFKNTWGIPFFDHFQQHYHPVVYGAFKVMATAYQSCSVLNIDHMPTHHPTKGVQILSQHPLGGWRRNIVNLPALNQSHYYISQKITPNSMACFNIYASPLIYDFGGKPAISGKSINLFKNAGSGSLDLGIDCSGFVATALATSGLKLKKNVSIRPIHIKGINVAMFKKANEYNLSCLRTQTLSLTNPLKSGDIIASHEHIAIVEKVGSDPFNLSTIHHFNECHGHKIDPTKFNFSIIQSSAHNDIGINRMHFAQAFDAHSPLGQGMQQVATNLCYKQFGMNQPPYSPQIKILRHLTGDPACRDKEIHLKNQECLHSCLPTSI